MDRQPSRAYDGPVPDRRGSRRALLWVAAVFLAVVQFFVGFVIAGLTAWGSQGVCGDPASVADLNEGRRVLLGEAVVGLLPWLLALVLARTRLRPWQLGVLALLGVVAVAPVVLITVSAWTSSPAEWSGGWCAF